MIHQGEKHAVGLRRHGAQAALHGGKLAAIGNPGLSTRTASRGAAQSGANDLPAARPGPRSRASSAGENRPISRSRNVSPRYSSSAFGEPMRRDSPAARMSPQVTSAQRAQALAGEHRHGERPPVANPRCAARRSSRPPPKWRSLPAKWRRSPDPWARTRARSAARAMPSFSSSLDHVDHFALAADHGDVARVGGDRPAQHAHVVAMAARHDDHVAGLVDGQLGEDFFVFLGVDFGGFRKALAVGEALAVIHDRWSRIRPGRPLWKGSSKCGRRRR